MKITDEKSRTRSRIQIRIRNPVYEYKNPYPSLNVSPEHCYLTIYFQSPPTSAYLQRRVESCTVRYRRSIKCNLARAALCSKVGDPHHFSADLFPSFHLNADPDPTFHFDADPDPVPCQSDANLRPFLASTSLFYCERSRPPASIRIRIQLFTLVPMRIQLFTLLRIRIYLLKIMRIRILNFALQET